MQTKMATENVATEYEAGLHDWHAKLDADEWYLANLRESVVAPLSPVEAFENVGNVVELLLRTHDEELRFETALLLLDLTRKSETTQLHPALSLNWEKLIGHVLPVHARELERWYRRTSA
jgi:hypothetical protein